MWLLRERLSDLEWNILHRVDSHIKHPQNSNHLRSHSRAIMALDHSRLDLENKFLENKSGQSFSFRQVYFTKSCQQIRGCVNQPFILFIHHIWGETVLFIIQISHRMQYFTIFRDKLHSVNIQEDQSWALRWLPRVFTNNPSYLAYVTERNLVTLSLRFCSRDSPI